MSLTRLEALQMMLSQDPTNNLARYGLAMEYSNSGLFAEAVAEFEGLLGTNPDYVAAYFHGGRAFEKMGRIEDARSIYERGLEACQRKGDGHTASEIQAALDLL